MQPKVPTGDKAVRLIIQILNQSDGREKITKLVGLFRLGMSFFCIVRCTSVLESTCAFDRPFQIQFATQLVVIRLERTSIFDKSRYLVGSRDFVNLVHMK